jgi:fumarate reductase flavoprotein subunit
VDPVKEPIPVRPAVHYTMGGIKTDITTASPLAGLFAVGECASVGLHGANRLGSNSLTELVVFGKQAGTHAAQYAKAASEPNQQKAEEQARASQAKVEKLRTNRSGDQRLADIRDAMGLTMEEGAGIYRLADSMQATCDQLEELRERYKRIKLDDDSHVFNTQLFQAIELESMLETARVIANSALERKESRGSHQRLDGFEKRDDVNYLQHTLGYYRADERPAIEYEDVVITTSQPAERVYGGPVKDPNQK